MKEYFDTVQENAKILLDPNVRDIKKSATLEINQKSI